LNLVECTSGLEYRCNSPTVHAHVRSKYSRAARIISRAQIFTVLVASSIFRALPSPSMTCLPTANFTRGRKSYIDNYRLFSPAATNPVLAKSAVHSRARACALSAFRVARRKIAAPRLINRSTSRIVHRITRARERQMDRLLQRLLPPCRKFSGTANLRERRKLNVVASAE